MQKPLDLKAPLELLSLTATTEERQHDFQPTTFDEYLGQEELKTKLKLYATAARQRDEPLDHTLLSGPPGLGKTTLAQLIAKIMNVGIKICSGPTLERTGDLVALLSSLARHEILFIDEIHRMPAPVEEVLYSALEQFRVDIIIGQGAGAKSVNLPLQPFTLVGATTKSGMLSAPLRSRFGINERLDFYSEDDLQKIVLQSAQFLKITLPAEAALLIAQAARGTPRIAKKMLRRVRDVAQVTHNNMANIEITAQALAFLGINPQGLCAVDEAIMKTIAQRFDGGPVGLETIASIIGEDSATIEEVYEPFLLRKGLLERTPRGRQIPAKLLPLLKKQYDGQRTIF